MINNHSKNIAVANVVGVDGEADKQRNLRRRVRHRLLLVAHVDLSDATNQCNSDR